MTHPASLFALEYAAETSFAESSTTFDGLRVPLIKPIDASGLTWGKQPSGAVQQYAQGVSPYVLMGKGGTFTTTMHLPGHGSTTVGSPTKTKVATLIGYAMGNSALSSAASTTLTGGTVTVPTTTASGTFSAGGICGIGTLGDGDGNGQMYPIATHTTTNLTLLADMDGAPVNGAVLYPCDLMYFYETLPSKLLATSVPGLRFRFLWQGLQYSCRGCFPTAISITGTNSGDVPQIAITWETSDWDAVTDGTYPSVLATEQATPGPIAAGSLHVQTVGTTTRNLITYRDFKIDITLGMAKLPGPGGVGQYQSIVGAQRMPSQIKVTIVADADAAATASPVFQGMGTDGTARLIMWTGSTGIGSAVGALLRNVHFSTVPTLFDRNGVASMSIEGMAGTGSTVTNDLTAAAMVLAFR